MGSGTGGSVFTISPDTAGGIFVGGSFTSAGGKPASRLSRWSAVTTDLTVSLSDAADPVTVPDDIVYTVTVDNLGTETAANTLVYFTLPATIPNSAAITSGCSNDPSGVPGCELGAIPAAGSASFTVTVTPPLSLTGTVAINVEVASDAIDDDLTNNAAVETTSVMSAPPQAALGMNYFSDSPDPAASGETLTYSTRAYNNGPIAATNPVFTFNLPAELTVISTSGCDEDPLGVPTCSVADLPSNSTSPIVTVVTQVDPLFTGSLESSASVSADEPDYVLSNNTRTTSTTVGLAQADLRINSLTANPNPAAPGNTLTYTLSVYNAGPNSAATPEIALSLPVGVTLSSTSGCNEDPTGVPTCTLTTLPRFQSTSITYTVDVDSGASGILSATASILSNTDDPDTGNNSLTTDTPVGSLVPTFTSPVAGSSLDGVEQTFSWSPNQATMAGWWLYLGTQPGQADLYNSLSLSGSTLSASVSGLSVDGSTVYATLWYRTQGSSTWQFLEATFTAAMLNQYPPAFQSPSPGSSLPGYTAEFIWNPSTISGVRYWLTAGASLGNTGYYSSGDLGAGLSDLADGLPTDGTSDVHVRLWYQAASSPWYFIDEVFTAGTDGPAMPMITSHNPGDSLAGAIDTLTWADGGMGPAAQYWIHIGSTQGAYNYFNESVGGVLSAPVSNLPVDGSDVWVRLWWKTNPASPWSHADVLLIAANLNIGMTDPLDGGTLQSSAQTFTWEDETGTVTEWWLYLGSTPGGRQIEDSGSLGAALTYTTQNLLPTGSVPVYVKLWSRVGTGRWQAENLVYTSAP